MNDISIRKITIEDTDNIVKWRNSPHVVENFIDRTPLTRETHLWWFENKINTGQVIQFITHDDVDDIDFGSVYLRDVDYKNKKAELGIFIGEKKYLFGGYGTTVVEKCVDYAFYELGLNKVYARIMTHNKPSYGIAVRLGFNTDGIFRDDVCIDGQYYDVYFVSLLKSDRDKALNKTGE